MRWKDGACLAVNIFGARPMVDGWGLGSILSWDRQTPLRLCFRLAGKGWMPSAAGQRGLLTVLCQSRGFVGCFLV